MTTSFRVLVAAIALVGSSIAWAVGSEVGPSASPTKTKEALPKDFPPLTKEREQSPNGPGPSIESDFVMLQYSNQYILNRLSAFSPDSISAEFGRRMEKETDIHVKLLLAAVAAANGNGKAVSFIQSAARETDYKITLSRLNALSYLIYAPHPQDWVFDAIYDALRDTRIVTGAEKAGWTGAQFEVSYLADEQANLTYALGFVRNPKSVPVLIEMARRTDGSRGSISALGQIGDPQAIPVCLEFLRRADALIKDHKANESEPPEELIYALADLKARDAVPILLQYLYSAKVIAALGKIGDNRAIAPLKDIVANHGKVKGDPYTWENRLLEREFAAKMALIKFEKDPYPGWFDVLRDQSLTGFQREEAVWELGNHPDARAIPFLINAIKSDPSGAVVNQAITVLSAYKYKAAAYELIGCFGADFNGKSDWKRAFTPEMFDENIGETLKSLTGRDFGTNKAQWLKWWTNEGSLLDSLK